VKRKKRLPAAPLNKFEVWFLLVIVDHRVRCVSPAGRGGEGGSRCLSTADPAKYLLAGRGGEEERFCGGSYSTSTGGFYPCPLPGRAVPLLLLSAGHGGEGEEFSDPAISGGGGCLWRPACCSFLLCVRFVKLHPRSFPSNGDEAEAILAKGRLNGGPCLKLAAKSRRLDKGKWFVPVVAKMAGSLLLLRFERRHEQETSTSLILGWRSPEFGGGDAQGLD